jgi:hypothetical protein
VVGHTEIEHDRWPENAYRARAYFVNALVLVAAVSGCDYDQQVTTFRPSLLALALCASTGCAQSLWTAVRLSPTNPLAGQRSFVVEPIHYENVVVDKKPEAEWLSEKSGTQKASWQADKADASAIFFQHLVMHAAGLQVAAGEKAPGPGTFVIRPICTSIQAGNLLDINTPTEMRMTIQVLDAKGEVVDEITSAIAVAAQIWNPSSGGRLRGAGKFHGSQVADFLHTRTGL